MNEENKFKINNLFIANTYCTKARSLSSSTTGAQIHCEDDVLLLN